jgi:hypothetical protein
MTEVREIQDDIRRGILGENVAGIPVVDCNPLPEWLLAEVKEYGLGIFGVGGVGKTKTAQLINAELMKQPNTQMKIFDKVQNWVLGFEPILYQTINEDVLTGAGYDVYYDYDHILFNTKIYRPEVIKKAISRIVEMDWELHWRFKEQGVLNRNIVYTIEEAQSVLGTIGNNDIWNTFISEGRNMNISFIFIGRRMAQVSAKARNNVQSYLWGRMTTPLDTGRVKAVAGQEVANIVKKLERGEFVYWDGSEAKILMNMPRYMPTTRPRMWVP